jgi:hypothetical protein
MLTELHIHQNLCQVIVDFIYILPEAAEFVIFVFGRKLVNRVKDKTFG